MPWWLADRGQTLDRESVRVRLPSSLTRRLGNNAGITKIKAQEGKGEPDTRLRVLDIVDSHVQPGQYDCHHYSLGRGPPRPSGCQTFLMLAAFTCPASSEESLARIRNPADPQYPMLSKICRRQFRV